MDVSSSTTGQGYEAAELLEALYGELRRLAASRLRKENNASSLQTTVLVHEAYIKLIGNHGKHTWDNRAHFFASAARAMQQILIEHARKKNAKKRGGDYTRQQAYCDPVELPDERLLLVADALNELEKKQPVDANVARMRIFCGESVEDAARKLGIAERTAYYSWKYAKSWLSAKLRSEA